MSKILYGDKGKKDIVDGTQFVRKMTETGILFESNENDVVAEFKTSGNNKKFLVRDNATVNGVEVKVTEHLSWDIQDDYIETWTKLKDFEECLSKELGYVIF